MARRAASLATRCSLCLALLAATLTSGARSLLQQADGRTAGAAPAEAGRDVAVSPSGAVGTAGHRGTAEATAAAPVTGHAGAAGGGGGSSGKSSPGPAEHHATARRLNTAGQASQVFPGQDAPSSSASRSLNSAATQFCSKQMTGRLLWTKATAGGRSCQAACRGLSGTPNGPYVAVNVGTGSSPSFVCRAYDISFNSQQRAGCSAATRGRALPCLQYSGGGPLPSVYGGFAAARSFECACTADRTRYAFSGCPAPVWKSTKSGWCPSVCEASGHRAALEDSSGTKKHICRPEPSKGRHSTLVGWAAFENAGPGRVGNACHYVAKQVSGSQLSVFTFSYQCLCI